MAVKAVNLSSLALKPVLFCLFRFLKIIGSKRVLPGSFIKHSHLAKQSRTLTNFPL